EERDQRDERVRRFTWVRRQQLLAELGERGSRRRLLQLRAARRRVADLVVLGRDAVQLLDRVLLARRDGFEFDRRLAYRLFEQRKEQLVLAGEVLVEAAQRLARTLDDLLDRELFVGRLEHQLERGVEESLHALFGPRPRRVERPGDGEL